MKRGKLVELISTQGNGMCFFEDPLSNRYFLPEKPIREPRAVSVKDYSDLPEVVESTAPDKARYYTTSHMVNVSDIAQHDKKVYIYAVQFYASAKKITRRRK